MEPESVVKVCFCRHSSLDPQPVRSDTAEDSMIGIFLLLVVTIIGLLLYIDAKKPPNFPPGPTWLPILGATLELSALRRRSGYLVDAVKELSKIYGPIVGIRVGKDRQVVLNGYEAVREMLSREEFDGKPKGPFYETRTWGKRRGLLLVDDTFWIEQRRFVLRHLREFGYGKRTMSDLVTEEAEMMVKDFKERLAENGDKPAIVEMRDVFGKLVFSREQNCTGEMMWIHMGVQNVLSGPHHFVWNAGLYVVNTLWKMLAGYRYSKDDAELLTLQSLLTGLLARVDMVGAPFSQFPLLRYLAPEKSGYNDFVQIHERIWWFLKIELERHKAAYDPAEIRDFMDVYLKMLSDPDRKPSFSEEQLLAICMDMFIAGSETTSKSLGFCFLYLVRHPEVQKKAQYEIDQVVGRSRLPDLSDRPALPYCDAVGLEGIRMFMARNFGIPHRALKDTTLMGYYIPKETMLVPNISSVLTDKTVWGDPEEFRPERFIDESGKVFIPDQYLPFGFGKHRCMGETLARSNLFIMTASLLQNFTFTVPPGEQPPTLEYMDGVTASTYPYNALVTPRPL